MTFDLGARRVCAWFVGIHNWRDVLDFAWHGRKLNPTWRLSLLGFHIELRRRPPLPKRDSE